ncbi:MAG TPA: hypothetical protein VF226_13220 [Hyphomicrobiaceae bacterium]
MDKELETVFLAGIKAMEDNRAAFRTRCKSKQPFCGRRSAFAANSAPE